MVDKYYVLLAENYHDSLQKAERKVYKDFNALLDAQADFSQKLATEIGNDECKHVFALVVDNEGKMQDDFKDYFDKYLAEDTKVFRRFLFVLFTYNDGTKDEIVWSGYDDPADAVSNFYSKRSSGMKKANISTITEFIVNSNCELEKQPYFWDKYAESNPTGVEG
jgi:hypothetical protein